jgi:hypothetical protein
MACGGQPDASLKSPFFFFPEFSHQFALLFMAKPKDLICTVGIFFRNRMK